MNLLDWLKREVATCWAVVKIFSERKNLEKISWKVAGENDDRAWREGSIAIHGSASVWVKQTPTNNGRKCENHFHLLCTREMPFFCFFHAFVQRGKNLVKFFLEHKTICSTFRGCFEGFFQFGWSWLKKQKWISSPFDWKN